MVGLEQVFAEKDRFLMKRKVVPNISSFIHLFIYSFVYLFIYLFNEALALRNIYENTYVCF